MQARKRMIQPQKIESTVLLLSTLVMSFATLTFELSLTRIFSVMFSYHYAFFAVSMAFAGLGLGGTLARSLFSNENPKQKVLANLAVISSLLSLLISFASTIIVSASSLDLTATSVLFFFPFLLTGVFLATAYRVSTTRSNVLYCADIVGASLGSLAILFFLGGFGPIITVLFVSIILSITSVFLALASGKKMVFVTVIVLFLLTISMQSSLLHPGGDVPIGADQGKELYEMLRNPSLGAKIVESRWSAFGRTDLVELRSDPNSKVIFIDGGSGTTMYRFNGSFADSSGEFDGLRFSTAAFPLHFTGRANILILIIGPGGGLDVLIAMMFNFSHVYAVEVNHDAVDIVREYSNFNGGIYTNYSNVHVYVDEGRSFLRRSQMKYDAIMLNIPITETIQGISGYSMAENYLFTTESFSDYLDHLESDGYLVIVTHDLPEIDKLTTTALRSLQSGGRPLREIMHQIVIIGMHHYHSPTFILKKSAFSEGEIDEIYRKSSELGLWPIYFPHISSEYFDQLLMKLANEELTLDMLISHLREEHGYDAGPPTDDSPFFFKFQEGLPPTLSHLLRASTAFAVVVAVLYLILWRRRHVLASKKALHFSAGKGSIFMPYYFASLGLGFMLIEVPLIQKFMLFLGPPTVAISATLFSLLLSMGLGSFFSKNWKEPTDIVVKVSLVIGILIVLYVSVLPTIFSAFLGFDLNTRILVSFALVSPLGFLMGMPFPTGIRIMERESKVGDITWMWAMNGLYSLLGSVLAVAIAMLSGFSAALLLGGMLYLLIFLMGTIDR